MAAVESQMLELGTEAPTFSLPDADGNVYSLRDDAKAHLVMFICNHCPFVKHVADELAQIGREYTDKDVAIYAINSNDTEKYPADGPEAMKVEAAQRGYSFPYLLDADQTVAKAYRAACTPDFYVFDADRKLVYRGQLDDSRPGNAEPVDGRDLRQALDATLAGAAPAEEQKASIGCNIKWKPGNEPDYY
jgi:peroxiredoxin